VEAINQNDWENSSGFCIYENAHYFLELSNTSISAWCHTLSIALNRVYYRSQKSIAKILKDWARMLNYGGELTGFFRKPVDMEKIYFSCGVSSSERTTTENLNYHCVAGGADRRAWLSRRVSHCPVWDRNFFPYLDPYPLHTCLTINFEIKDTPITLETEVVYNCTFDEGPFKEPVIGMKFVKISPENQSIIKAFVLEKVKKSCAVGYLDGRLVLCKSTTGMKFKNCINN
jgi:hypothetical protein